MAIAYIGEYSGLAMTVGGGAAAVVQEPAVTTQKVTFTTATASAAFNAATRVIYFIADADCRLLFGAAPVATADHPLYKANVAYYFGVAAGHKVSVYDGAS